VFVVNFFWSSWHIVEPQLHSRCPQQSGVYSLPRWECCL